MSNYDYMEVWSGPLTSYGRGLLLWLVYRPGSFYYHKSSSLEDIPLNIPLILHSVVPTFKFLDLSFLSFSDCEPLNCSKSDPKMVLSTPQRPLHRLSGMAFFRSNFLSGTGGGDKGL